MELLYLLSEASLGSGPPRSAQNIGQYPGTYAASRIELAPIRRWLSGRSKRALKDPLSGPD
ncbi:hypothetical protein StoSoilA2_11810 [Arthrobacter sp. StoSoilA2]|nr:hypothetical protein StoSoilA2_11810 [Arthrobacter sp. StoSoilA2]